MSGGLTWFSRVFAGSAVFALLCGPVSALDVGASIGGIGAGASIGGGKASAGVSAGGVSAGASVGSSGAQAGASIGGTSASASVGAAGVGASVGGSTGTNPSGSAAQGVSNAAAGRVAGMSGRQLERTRKRCTHILASGVRMDPDLVALCKLVQTASR